MRLASVLAFLAAAAAAAAAAAHEGDYPSVSIGRGVLSASLKTADLELRLSSRPRPDIAADWLTPRLEVLWKGETVAVAETTESAVSYFPASAGVVEMDGGNDTPEVVLDAYTGGAHCCTELVILSKDRAGAWRTIEAGLFDAVGGRIADVDGDGVYEIEGQDESFLYRFGCYACSAAPLAILVVADAEIRDATFEPRFQAAHRAYLAELEQDVKRTEAGNGYLAGWVAQKIILGEGAEAWAEMLMSYDRNDSWGLDECRNGAAECDDAGKIVRPYPQVLKEFLNERGFRP